MMAKYNRSFQNKYHNKCDVKSFYTANQFHPAIIVASVDEALLCCCYSFSARTGTFIFL